MTNQTKLKGKTLGQYYTPTYIVDYIIDQTIGYLIKTNYDKISSLKVLDPACGMGIFLMRALDFLSSHQRPNVTPEKLRRRIIANQLYGIDIDPIQIRETLNNLHCPEFNINVKSFNALIPPPSYPFQFDSSPLELLRSKLKKDYINGKRNSVYNKEQQRISQIEKRLVEIIKTKLINDYGISSVTQPMIWKMVFPETKGIFDIIVGNPPWGANLFSSELLSSYNVGTQQFDSWSLFIERCLAALTEDGRLGFVIPNTLLLNENYVEVRKFILKSCKIVKIVNLGENIFSDITQPSMIIIAEKNQPSLNHKFGVIRHIPSSLISELKTNQKTLSSLPTLSCSQDRFLHTPDFQFEIFSIGYEELKEAIQKDLHGNKIHVKPLRDLVTNARGVELNKNGKIVQCSSCGWWSSPPSQFNSKGVKAKLCANPKCHKIVTQHDTTDLIIFDNPYQPERDKPIIIGQQIQRYCIKNHKYIDPTRDGIKYKDPALYLGPKLLLRKTGYGIKTAIDYSNRWVNQVIYLFKLKKHASVPLEYIMGVLNSTLIHSYFFIEFADPYRRDFPHFTQKKFLRLPIRIPNTDHEFNLVKQVAKAAKTLQCLYQKRNSFINQKSPKSNLNVVRLDGKIQELEKNVDELVLNLYEIPPDLQTEDFLSRNKKLHSREVDIIK